MMSLEEELAQADRDELAQEIECLRRRIAELEEPETSGLADELSETDAEIVTMIEDWNARALTILEAYWLGMTMRTYGPERVKKALLQKRYARNPLRAAIVYLKNKNMGQEIPKKEMPTQEVSYWIPPDDYDPWAK